MITPVPPPAFWQRLHDFMERRYEKGVREYAPGAAMYQLICKSPHYDNGEFVLVSPDEMSEDHVPGANGRCLVIKAPG